MGVLFKNIKNLLQVREPGIRMVAGNDMGTLPSIQDAYLLTEGDRIRDFGPMSELPYLDDDLGVDLEVDATGKLVLPSWCDSHTHLVYTGNRESEFVDRIKGLSYEEIAERGGGILNSARKLQQTAAEQIYKESAERLKEVIRLGTGAIEIKSGYGLTTEAELKMLEVIKQLRQSFTAEIKATFLGAHAFPVEFRGNEDAYVDLICKEMIPAVSSNKLASFIDAFCETGYFNTEQTARILKTGKAYGLPAKIHVNQFTSIGGINVAVQYDALSVDHLEVMKEEDFEILSDSTVMPVALPTCSYFLSIPYSPGRKIIDMGMPLAIASDFNPGSTPSGNMNFVVSTACIKMGLTPEEAINAATLNGAYAMDLSDTHGSITRGKKANLILTKNIPSYGYLPYAFGSDHIDQVMINGKFFE